MLSRSLHLLIALLVLHSAAAVAQEVPKVSLSPVVRVTLQLDSASTARFDAHGFDLHVAQSGLPSAAEIQLIKVAGPSTGDLVSLSANATRAPAATIEVLDSLGRPAVTLRLRDIAVVSDHLSLSAARANLEQQRISQQEALSALTADHQEAQRQLATLEELGKTRVATRLDLARARDRASDLQRRIDLLKQRQALLASLIAGQGPVDETIVLHFGQLQIESNEPGGRALIDFVRRPIPKRN
ncbi:MAG TPA: hypothetical protein VGP95_02120 [Gemmatimonadaceae bacterium]|nr:hypothetical protein [Gemmatimonadaceae bacterium]